MSILARRPAPLQVAYLGYPGSTGPPYIDYLIGDALVTPLQLARCTARSWRRCR
jgi:predicted O-linked N-acetylglucosamine transferase (SPINDLY family)